MRRISFMVVCMAASGSTATLRAQMPLGTNFTYQGRLVSAGVPANGSHDFIFRLWDAPTGGNNLGASNATLTVTNGLFTANLDFGAQFDGDQRWIDMLVRQTGMPSYTPLSPRQPISATPYAHTAVNALSVDGLDGHSLDAADGSPTDAVFVDSSGNVGIRTSQPSGLFEVADGTASPGGLQMDQANEVAGDFQCTAPTSAGPWQSFTAGVAGVLTRIDMFLGTFSGGQVVVEVRAGQGTAGSLLGDAIFTPAYSGSEGWAVIDLTALNPNPINVNAGSAYTIRLSGGSYAWDASCSNAYPGGIASIGAGFDFNFRTFVNVPANTGSLFVVQPSGGVRIRVPAATLSPALRVLTPTGEELQVSKDCRINSFNHSLSLNGASDENIFLANGGGNVLMGTYANEDVNNPHGLSKYLYIAGDSSGSFPGSAGVIFNRPAGGTWSVGVNGNGSFSFFASTGVSSPIVYVPALGVTGGSDIAEPFNVVQSRDREGAEYSIEPGMVVSIDPDRVGELRLSREAYDSTVAGIISGAGGVRPGLTLTQEDSVADGKHPVALTGRVWCWCDADAGGAIRAGDLLTTSDTRGHAMKVSDRQRAGGAILGKAMSSLESGKGLVLVLVNLQ